MNNKDLAKEYVIARLQDKLSDDEISFSENRIFTKEDIKVAFNAGRKSVIENIPRLLFKETKDGLIADNGIFEFIYHIYKSTSVDEPKYAFAISYETPTQWYDTLEEAMNAANKDYKKRLKQVLGL